MGVRCGQRKGRDRENEGMDEDRLIELSLFGHQEDIRLQMPSSSFLSFGSILSSSSLFPARRTLHPSPSRQFDRKLIRRATASRALVDERLSSSSSTIVSSTPIPWDSRA